MLVDVLSILIASLALFVSCAAAWFTLKMLLLKSGLELRGSYSLQSSIYCDDKIVGSVTIENCKDRSIALFNIFLQVGHNYYIELDDFETKPLILQPFEVLHREYEPI